MKFTEEELIDNLPLALMLMYLAYKVYKRNQDSRDDFILHGKDDSFFFNKYMH